MLCTALVISFVSILWHENTCVYAAGGCYEWRGSEQEGPEEPGPVPRPGVVHVPLWRGQRRWLLGPRAARRDPPVDRRDRRLCTYVFTYHHEQSFCWGWLLLMLCYASSSVIITWGWKRFKPSVSALFLQRGFSWREMHARPSTSSLAGRQSSFSPCKIYGLLYM